MTDVIAWPPVGLTAWELTRVDPVSRSVGLLDGRPRTSSAQRSRRLATAQVSAFGPDRAGAGYIEMLKEFLAGGRHLVRVDCPSPLSPLVTSLNLKNGVMQWTSGGDDMEWTAGGSDLLWSDNIALTGEPRTDKGWPALRVEGLPKNSIVARPSDRITVTDANGNTESSRVLTVARSGGLGNATIRTRDAFTLSGLVSIGDKESIVFEALNMPRAVQPVSGSWGYDWNFREVFQDEYDSWTERNPWT
ncbi:hypothetical protein [Limimaricola cinnabarinus]|uniref:hypothetical protein n=1 Tax=Limimaricola cinnabarinus TaxID=1125964 RepID=UPI0024937811|nr:hypothetical protein [Limimaricola cinnabarinus]